jgi:hypothetical protein
MTDNLKFKINKEVYSWPNQFITGGDIRSLIEIPNDDLLFLELKKPLEDELIEINTKVDLTRPGIEKFYTKKNDDHLPFRLYVNGREVDWSLRNISYDQVVKLAFPNYSDNGTIVYTVTYSDGPGQNPEGSMVKGDIVLVKNKMKFNVTATNKS